MTEGGLAAVTADWGIDDVLLDTAGPPRSRPGCGWPSAAGPRSGRRRRPDEIRTGDLAIDEATYTAKLRGRALDLTFKEFELLKFLAQHPGRVFTRAQLLQEVWGYDYFGGTRTVDVHVRRLRAKLGPEHEALIGTVRNVGYRFVPGSRSTDAEPATDAPVPRCSELGAASGRPVKPARLDRHRTAVTARLEPPAQVMRLVEAATDADGVSPLSEHVLLHLRYGGDPRGRQCAR